MPNYDPDFSRIRPLNGDRRLGFEEFCAQLARHDNAPADSRFVRLEGAGGDGGVECYWELADGTEWGYQSKFLDRLDKAQITASVETALRIHPNLTRYVVCLPFDLSGRTGRRGSDQQTRWTDYVGEWQQLAADRGLIVSFEAWPKTELIERLVRIDPTCGRRRFWFHEETLSTEWFAAHIVDATSDAGPRYHPELNVEVPISSQLSAFGETPAWKASYSLGSASRTSTGGGCPRAPTGSRTSLPASTHGPRKRSTTSQLESPTATTEFPFPCFRPCTSNHSSSSSTRTMRGQSTCSYPHRRCSRGGELLWDGAGGYRDGDRALRFVAPNLTEPGPQALLAERESFLRWLDDNGLAIVWTTLSEMHWSPPGLGHGHNLGYGVHSRAHRVVDAAVKKSRGVTRRIRPNADAV
jgi:hypothetical protein